MDDDDAVNRTLGGLARILLIADDATLSQNYAGALQAAGYDVTQAESFVDVLGTAMPDPDAIVLCELAVFAYPGQAALVIRAANRMAPDDLVAEVHLRLALRATLLTTVG
jgi:ActR/RegA family two-component response regulator